MLLVVMTCLGERSNRWQRQNSGRNEWLRTCFRLRRCSVASRRISASSSMCDSAAKSSSEGGGANLCGDVVMTYCVSAGDGTMPPLSNTLHRPRTGSLLAAVLPGHSPQLVCVKRCGARVTNVPLISLPFQVAILKLLSSVEKQHAGHNKLPTPPAPACPSLQAV